VPGDLSLISETVRDVLDVQAVSVLQTDFNETAEVEDGVVALGHGWKVREASKFDTEELRAVAHVQATSFHLQAAVFDELFFKLFKAEVLSALLYKARHSPPDRYACLLAEPATELSGGESGDTFFPIVVGAVNLAAAVDNEVLRHLHNATEYLYVSGMAVDINYRRRNVATMLLRACELLAMKWGFDYLVLHAYEDDMAARTLYSRGGYRVIALDPMWMSTWIGRKRRVLMAKRTSRTPNFDF
jgi:ribosomal protein S18 acetylase RimI-like enzyme